MDQVQFVKNAEALISAFKNAQSKIEELKGAQ